MSRIVCLEPPVCTKRESLKLPYHSTKGTWRYGCLWQMLYTELGFRRPKLLCIPDWEYFQNPLSFYWVVKQNHRCLLLRLLTHYRWCNGHAISLDSCESLESDRLQSHHGGATSQRVCESNGGQSQRCHVLPDHLGIRPEARLNRLQW